MIFVKQPIPNDDVILARWFMCVWLIMNQRGCSDHPRSILGYSVLSSSKNVMCWENTGELRKVCREAERSRQVWCGLLKATHRYMSANLLGITTHLASSFCLRSVHMFCISPKSHPHKHKTSGWAVTPKKDWSILWPKQSKYLKPRGNESAQTAFRLDSHNVLGGVLAYISVV